MEIHFRSAPFFGSRKGGGREKQKGKKKHFTLLFIDCYDSKQLHTPQMLEEYRKIGVQGKAFYKKGDQPWLAFPFE